MDISPPFQRALKWAGFLLAGALAVGAALDAVSNAISLVSLSVAIFSTAIIVAAWLLVETAAALFGISWSGGARIRSLGPRVRLGTVGVLSLLWLPQLGKLSPPEPSIPDLQVELRNPTESTVSISTRGQFVLWLPTALYDGAPRVGGRVTITPLRAKADSDGEFNVPAGASVRCSVAFLNPKRFLAAFEGQEADASLVLQTSRGTRISPNFVFSRGVVGEQQLVFSIEGQRAPPAPQ